MNNIENNKIYKLGQLTLKAITILSAIIMVIRLFAPNLVSKISWLSSYAVWRFFDWGLEAFIEHSTFALFMRLLISIVIVYGIYVVCLLLSKKSILFMVIAFGYFSVDTILYIIGMIINIKEDTALLIIGLIFKLLILAVIALATKYGFIGLQIESSGHSFAPDIKYVSKNFSTELTGKNRVITLERDKSFFNSHIYLQIVVDGNTVGYLKDGEAMDIETDANQHTLYIISHFAEIMAIKRVIPIGEENNSYLVAIEKEKRFSKKLEIYKK